VTGRRVTPRRVILVILVAAVAIQFIPVTRTNPPADIEVDPPADVHALLRRACYDCHSHETRWPWYSRVAPVSWLVAHDVHEGRKDLDFSDWPAFDFDLQGDLLADVAKQVKNGKMPPSLYTFMHVDARLTDEERARILAWARGE